MTGPVSPANRTGRRESLLDSLLADPLDPGYADAARRRAERSAGPTDGAAGGAPDDQPLRGFGDSDRILVAAGAALIGLILVVAYLHASRSAPVDARTRADLRGRVAAAEREGDDLDRRVQSLAASADVLRRAALGSGPDAAALTRAEAAAGTIAVRGPGVQVVLGNPPVTASATTGRPGSTPISAVSALTDVDVRAVVNELWLDGAEAVAVNGVRLLPTSAIRFAGEAVLVDFRPITSPYRVQAIGDSDRLITAFTDSSVADRYRTLASADGFAFSSSAMTALQLPAGVAAPTRYARPVSGPAPTSSSPTSSSPTSSSPTSTAPPSGGSSTPTPGGPS